MLDPLSLFTGAALVGVGHLLGRRRRGQPDKALTPRPTPTCGCGCALAMHDLKTGECHGQIRRKDGSGDVSYVKCTCRHYTGPVPITDLFTPQILPSDQNGG